MSGKYTHISIDTSIFDHHTFDFDGGVLCGLEHLDSGQFVISRVVVEEAKKRLSCRVDDLLAPLKKVISKPHVARVLFDGAADVFEDVVSNGVPNSYAHIAVEGFLERTSATIVEISLVDTESLMKLYFSNLPPFGGAKKKHEFPDAVSLMALERWAADNAAHILVVSSDNDWNLFCEKSERLDCVGRLAEALEIFSGGAYVVAKDLRIALQEAEEKETRGWLALVENVETSVKNKFSLNYSSMFECKVVSLQLSNIRCSLYRRRQEIALSVYEARDAMWRVEFLMHVELSYHVNMDLFEYRSEGGNVFIRRQEFSGTTSTIPWVSAFVARAEDESGYHFICDRVYGYQIFGDLGNIH